MAAMPSTAATAAVARSTWPSLDEWPSMRSMKKYMLLRSRSKLAAGSKTAHLSAKASKSAAKCEQGVEDTHDGDVIVASDILTSGLEMLSEVRQDLFENAHAWLAKVLSSIVENPEDPQYRRTILRYGMSPKMVTGAEHQILRGVGFVLEGRFATLPAEAPIDVVQEGISRLAAQAEERTLHRRRAAPRAVPPADDAESDDPGFVDGEDPCSSENPAMLEKVIDALRTHRASGHISAADAATLVGNLGWLCTWDNWDEPSCWNFAQPLHERQNNKHWTDETGRKSRSDWRAKRNERILVERKRAGESGLRSRYLPYAERAIYQLI